MKRTKGSSVRVYHFLNADYGLHSIQKRKLKISLLNELNDPFEFFAINLADKILRKALKKTKAELAQENGLLCFSKNWNNPLLWGHYADKHRGLCLGFDIPDHHLIDVNYIDERIDGLPQQINESTMKHWISTKYIDWAYEDEARAFLNLNDKCTETGLYFSDYNEEMKLRQVIIGCKSIVTRRQIKGCLNGYTGVEIFSSRAAFQSFRVVKNNNAKQ